MVSTLAIARAPVIYSHSSAFALCNHYRNVQDDVLKLTKTNGGLVMVNFYDKYVTCYPMNGTESTLAHVADHIDYIKNLIGVDHVGIGADYDGVKAEMSHEAPHEDMLPFEVAAPEEVCHTRLDTW
ncbi:DPEP1-like protein [Mya arenaria]|uniref:Dipeptidase n=1 Tax=Mya arenaria TaxID=6604 RepID=A0ABY7DC85_MYAAR|nr:DPEP1-like protein [Mya arenaria]